MVPPGCRRLPWGRRPGDSDKRAQYRQDKRGAYRFTPLSVETFGRLGAPLMRLLSDIGNLAVSRGDGLFTKEQFVSGVLQELSVGLCKTNARLEGFALGMAGAAPPQRSAIGISVCLVFACGY
jgi:hypothetical protein